MKRKNSLFSVVLSAVAPPAGGYELGALVYLTTTTEGAAIYYTTDGTEPTAGTTAKRRPLTKP